jgi:hypothetical protein
MPNYTQKNKATKGNMAAQKKGAKPDYPDIDGDGNKTESMKQAAEDKKTNPKAAQQRGKVNLMKQKAKAKASKNKSAASKKKGNPTSNISKASLVLNPNKKVFKTIEANNNYEFKKMKEQKYPEMAAPMKGYHPGKMSDTDMGIEERYGKQATSDALAAQQKGNPIMPNFHKDEYTDSGMNYRDANSKVVKGSQVDEGELSSVIRKSPERPHVVGSGDSMYANEKLYLDKAAKMHAQHPSKKRMADMVTKVATYNMPNVKAAQKKYHK